MKLRVEGEFKNKEEFEREKNKVRELLKALDFENVSCSEDLISNKWYFNCEKREDL